MTKRLVILASGNGSLAQAIIDSTRNGTLDAQIVAVLSDQPQAAVIKRAKDSGIRVIVCEMKSERSKWDDEIDSALEALDADLIVSAGFMRILAPQTVRKFQILNSHPALLPRFPGAHAVRDAIEAGVTETGTTIHWVDQGIDTGQIIAQEKIQILASDTEDVLHERIKVIERRLYVETLVQLLSTLEPSHGAT
jgi:phosphoribosylglycinamide formyltransferase-1